MSNSNSNSSQIKGGDNWVSFSELDKTLYSVSLSGLSFFSSFLTHPLNVLSIRQQAGNGILKCKEDVGKKNVFNALVYSFHSIGLNGLYRGWLPIAIMGK